ncbi:AMP-binding protein [Burkholderia sp. BDU5]|uniref:AMP-binding protein n=1 Tax=Burkholderia sp. BDU5 TaxID=1385590 RepID=UPI000A59E64F|nr:AMP-binding protein [Burkholderia sp. BDU5]
MSNEMVAHASICRAAQASAMRFDGPERIHVRAHDSTIAPPSAARSSDMSTHAGHATELKDMLTLRNEIHQDN